MDADKSRTELQAELTEVENDLADVRRNAAELRSGIGDSDDPADRGAMIQQADEQDRLAEDLAARHESLLRHLAGT
jgi:hypothetical protein